LVWLRVKEEVKKCIYMCVCVCEGRQD
jgi:hypothetical protein